MEVGIFDHQSIFCTWKVLALKTCGIHKYLNFRSFKNYTVASFKEALKQLDFPSYEFFDDVNGAYCNFLWEIMTAIDKIAPYRNKQIKGNPQKWLDSELLEKLSARDRLFKKFKKSRLSIGKELN